MDIDRGVRVRAFLSKWFAVAALALVLLAAVSGWWAYQVNLVPDVEEREQLVEQWSESTSFNHSALIINESIPFEKGEVVTDRPIYYTNLSKSLNGTYRYRYDADEGNLNVKTDTVLLIRAGELEDQEVQAVFWEVAEPLASKRANSLDPGEVHAVEFTVDIPFVLRTIETVETQLGATEGLVDVRVQSVTKVRGEVEGRNIRATHTSEMIMVVNPATFRVVRLNLVEERHQRFERVRVVVEPSPLEQFGSIGLFALAVVGLLTLGVAGYGDYLELTDEERELLEVEQQRDQFGEWITRGTFPSERNYEETILVDDLEGLIDVAIDTNKRVIEDTQLGVSAVLDGDYIYIYVRPDSPARDWLTSYADTTLDEFDQYEF